MIQHILLLSLATIIWGAGFIASKWTFQNYDPVWSNTIRFLFASAFILPYLFYKDRIKNWAYYKGPFICAVILLLAMQTQTIGLKYTTAGKSGFLTTFYALFTPIILIFTQKDRYQKTFWLLLGLALLGIAFMCDLNWQQFNKGDLWILISAFMYSIHIILVFKYARDYDAIILNGLQCVFVALMALPFSFVFNPDPNFALLLNPEQLTMGSSLSGFIFLGLFSSNIAFTIQAYSQKFIPPHIVGLVFLMESIFAAVFGYLILDEKVSFYSFIGAMMVLSSVALIPKFGRKIN